MQGAEPILIIPDWPAPAQVRAVSTERSYGWSEGDFRSCNFGVHVGDTSTAVATNRAVLTKTLGLTNQPCWLDQIHSTSVLDLDSYYRHRREETIGTLPAADGAVSSRVDRACVVMTADCLPVLFCDNSGSCVGIAHAGWRGLASGVLPAVIASMGINPRDLMAWLGPAISQSAYEVGREVREAFVGSDSGAAVCFEENESGRWQADLYGLARRSLQSVGLQAIYGGNFCTYTESERFFSYRRANPCGRMATLIWLASSEGDG
jgi:YfiH family protein